MQVKPDSPEHHRQRSEFIRNLVQRRPATRCIKGGCGQQTPRTIVQFWHDPCQLPHDIGECIESWLVWETRGFTHRLFDEGTARDFIGGSLGGRHQRAFKRCYHPAMQADYFRLCYLLVEGGFYVDADDVCVSTDINWLFEDGRLKLQPLCYDIASQTMVKASDFLRPEANDANWIFYFNNNPLIAMQRHPIIERALIQATNLLELYDDDALPEIQETTGPGNISRAIFDLRLAPEKNAESELVVLQDWDSIAVSKWPLSHRDDSRNWRLSNRQRFDRTNG